jgi:hypothetical protein
MVDLMIYHYDCPFPFTGKLNNLVITLGPKQFTKEEQAMMPAIKDRVARAKD